MTRPKILFWVQHLLGIGHLRRAVTLTRALQAGGFAVTVASGGRPLPDLDLGGAGFVQLPSARAVDIYFKDLRDDSDNPIDDSWRESRSAELQHLFDRLRPDIILTELFPFGRRQFRFELVPLMEAARASSPRPLIAASVRDILVQPPKEERRAEMVETARQFFDLVLVHGDPSLVAFEETFPLMSEIADLVRYTGYVVDSPTDLAKDAGKGEVLVSAGGGAVSEPLLRAAMAARKLSPLADHPWRFLVGHNLPQALLDELRAEALPGVIVERARGDFTTLLRNCLLSISQGGYNTVMEVLDARARAVIVPYAGGLETEQTLRAERLAARGALHVVDESDLSPESIASAIGRAMSAAPSTSTLDMAGARVTVSLLRAAFAARSKAAAS